MYAAWGLFVIVNMLTNCAIDVFRKFVSVCMNVYEFYYQKYFVLTNKMKANVVYFMDAKIVILRPTV